MEKLAKDHTAHGEGPAPPVPHERRQQPPPEEEAGSGLPKPAQFYLAAVYGIAIGAALAAYVGGPASIGSNQLVAFVVFTSLATVSQLFMVDAPNRQSYHATPAFLLAGAYLLDPALLVPMVVLALIPEWIKYRYPWYIQSFNIATYLLNVLAAWAALHIVAPGGLSAEWRPAAGVLAAGPTFAILNHVMVAMVLKLARGISVRDSGLFGRESIETDLALLAVGAGIATFWAVEPMLIFLQLIPLALFFRALRVPKLQEEAHQDAKTGLLSARRFMELFDEDVEKAVRTGHPLSVLMCDLDLFRNVNNTYGHLAGDEVLQAVAALLKRTFRTEDLVGRFGGEEFVVLLRNTDSTGAAIAGERVRREVRDTDFHISASAEPLKLTISVGVASFPDSVHDAKNLLHDADLAVYRSKLAGRNRVTIASPVEQAPSLAPDGAYLRIMESLAFALDARGAAVEGRTLRVTALTLAVAREMGVPEQSPEWRAIEQASLLHDVGKLAISSSVLYKQGPLTEEEWDEMRRHPEIGWAMLSQMEILRPAARIVLHHHEHWDGTGYPGGVSGFDIPIGARIFTVVDAYDAITSDRPYRAAQSESVAVQEILKNSGTQFDPSVVVALLKVLGHPLPSRKVTTAA